MKKYKVKFLIGNCETGNIIKEKIREIQANDIDELNEIISQKYDYIVHDCDFMGCELI